MSGMTQRATQRPEGFTKPANWTNEPPPAPTPASTPPNADGDHDGLSPTRYGDWVRNGIAVDF
jgi:hypothetical protein